MPAAPSPDERRGQADDARDHPATRDDGEQPDAARSIGRRGANVPLEGRVFAQVPLGPGALRERVRCPTIRFDQTAREPDAQAHPAQAPPEEDRPERRGEAIQTRSSADNSGAASARTPAASASSSVASSAMNPPPIASEPTASASMTRPSSWPAPSLRISSGSSPNSSGEQPLFQRRPRRSRPCPEATGRTSCKGDQAEERERPCSQPRRVQVAPQRRPAEQPPRDDPEHVLSGMRACEQDESAAGAGRHQLLPEAGVGWKPDQPTRLQRPAPEPLRDQRARDAWPPRRPDVRLLDEPLGLRENGAASGSTMARRSVSTGTVTHAMVWYAQRSPGVRGISRASAAESPPMRRTAGPAVRSSEPISPNEISTVSISSPSAAAAAGGTRPRQRRHAQVTVRRTAREFRAARARSSSPSGAR